MAPAWTLRPYLDTDGPGTVALLDLVCAGDPVSRAAQAVHTTERDEPGAFSRSVVAVERATPTHVVDERLVGAGLALPGLALADVARASPDPTNRMQTRPQEEGNHNSPASEIIGAGTVYESAFALARWRLLLQVHPDHRRRGVGSA